MSDQNTQTESGPTIGQEAGKQDPKSTTQQDQPAASTGAETKSTDGAGDDLTPEQNAKLANQLSSIVDRALERVKPLLDLITESINKANATDKEDLDEKALVEKVRPLLEQATSILQETLGAVKGADPDGKIANAAKRNTADHTATPEEQHLAQSLSKITEDVVSTINNAKEKIKDMPTAKRDLGPLFDVLGDPLFQILSAVGLLLNGVLRLVGNLLGSLGLGGIVNGLLDALGLKKLLGYLGLDQLSKSLTGGGKKDK